MQTCHTHLSFACALRMLSGDVSNPQQGDSNSLRGLQKEGALQIARPKGSPPLPPFEQWSFKERRYIQWLADMHNTHYALEASVADATVVASTEHYGAHLVRPSTHNLCTTVYTCNPTPAQTT